MPASKLTPQLREAICAKLRKGHYLNSAAAACGIHKSTIFDWIDRGNAARLLAEQEPLREAYPTAAAHRKAVTEWRAKTRAEKPYLEFVDAVDLARDAGEAWLLDQIIEMCTSSDVKHNKWTGLMTVLERTRRDRWGRRSVTEHATPDGKPFPVAHSFDPSKLSNEQLAQLQLLLEAARPDDT